MAAAKLGADVLFLNTAFAGPQLSGVLERENPRAVIYDEEFAPLLAEGARERLRVLAWRDADETPTTTNPTSTGSSPRTTPPRWRPRPATVGWSS